MTLLSTCTPSKMTRKAFVEHFKDLYEHSPWVAEGVFDLGLSTDLDDVETLLIVFQRMMLGANKSEQLALICQTRRTEMRQPHSKNIARNRV